VGLFGKKKKSGGADAKNGAASVAIQGNAEELAAVIAATTAAQDSAGELVAAIAAALDAYSEELYVPSLNIGKIRRAQGTRPAWALAGLSESIEARVL